MRANEFLTEVNWKELAAKAGNVAVKGVDAMVGSNTRGFKVPGEYEKRLAKQSWENWNTIIQSLGNRKEKDGQKVTAITEDEVRAAWKYFVDRVIKVEVPSTLANSIINLTMQEISNDTGTIKSNRQIGKVFHNIITYLIAQKGAGDKGNPKDPEAQDDETSQDPEAQDDAEIDYYNRYAVGDSFEFNSLSLEIENQATHLLSFAAQPKMWFDIEVINSDPLTVALGEPRLDRSTNDAIDDPFRSRSNKIRRLIGLRINPSDDFIFKVQR